MSAPLLHVGDAAVWPSWFGGHIVDNGSAFPQHFNDRRAAYAEAAARSLNSPPVGIPEPAPATGLRVVTAGGAGLPDDQFPNPVVGHAPGPSVTSPGDSGPGASPEDLSLPRLNGAPQ